MGWDAYSWSTLSMPWSYGRKGGTTAKDVDYGEGGDGRVKLDLKGYLVVDGSILVDGGEGVTKEVVVLVGAFTSWHIRYKFLT